MTTDNMPPLLLLPIPEPCAGMYALFSEGQLRTYAQANARAYAEQQTAELRAEVEQLRKALKIETDKTESWKRGAEYALDSYARGDVTYANAVAAIRKAKLSRPEQS